MKHYKQKGKLPIFGVFSVVQGLIHVPVEEALASGNIEALFTKYADIAVTEMLTAWNLHKDNIEAVDIVEPEPPLGTIIPGGE